MDVDSFCSDQAYNEYIPTSRFEVVRFDCRKNFERFQEIIAKKGPGHDLDERREKIRQAGYRLNLTVHKQKAKAVASIEESKAIEGGHSISA